MHILPDNTVNLTIGNTTLLSGHEFDGLYFYNCVSVRTPNKHTSHQPKKHKVTTEPDDNTTPRVMFGLEANKTLSATHGDFSQKLLDAHCAYGHIHFNSLLKILGLKAGDNPDCASCTIAKSKAEALSKHVYTRSTRPCHRMHMDVGFTAGYQYSFQLYIDDYTRESFLEMLDDKSHALPEWTKLKKHQEIKHYPLKYAIIRTDSEPLYHTPEWAAHVEEHSMDHEASSRYRHDQHGVGTESPSAACRPSELLIAQ